MKKILEKYKKRLIDINGRNRSIKSNKIVNARAFDLSVIKYSGINDPQIILNKILNRQESLISLFKTQTDNEDEYLQQLEKNIKTLKREVDVTFKETGTYNLYVGYPFVEGCLADGTFIRCPLFLFPVEIKKNNNEWLIKNVLSQNIVPNKAFIKAFEYFNDIKTNFPQDDSFFSFHDFKESLIKNVLDYYKDIKIEIKDISNNELVLEYFQPYSKTNTPVYKNNELVFKNYCILGQFPISNSLYEDYTELVKMNLPSNSSITNLLTTKDTNIPQNYCSNDISPLYISELDYSQENVVKKTHDINNLVIYGAAGTGKSQTIVNIISSHLAQGKKVLMISQKKAALDVVYSRLAGVSENVCYINDVGRDKKAFYEKILNGNSNYESKKIDIDFLDTRIKEIEKEIIEIIYDFEKPTWFGLSLKEMYLMTERIISTNDPRFDYYKNFLENASIYSDYLYNQTKNNIDLIKEKYLDIYFKYRKIKENNPIYGFIRQDFNLIKKVEFLAHKDEIIKTLSNFKIVLKSICKENSFLSKNTNLKAFLFQNNTNTRGQYKILCNTYIELLKTDLKDISLLKRILLFPKIIINTIQSYKNFKNDYNKGLKAFNYFNKILEPEYVLNMIKCFDNIENVLSIIKQIENIGQEFETYKELNFLLHGTPNKNIQNILEVCYNENYDNFEFFIDNFLDFLILNKLDQLEVVKGPEIYNYKKIEGLISELKIKKEKKNRLTTNFLLNLNNNTQYSTNFLYQASKQRQLWSIRDFVNKFQDEIFNRFPCWLLSPENISNIFPLKEGLFDVIIFDEASQMFIEESIPTIYRGKTIIVAGDDKQLQPNKVGKIKEYLDEHEDESIVAIEQESLLDIAKINYSSTNLNYHYRSQYNELIDFSNHAFYNCNLEISPSIDKNITPIKVLKVDGIWDDRQNEIEANQVVSLVFDILKNRKNNETVGIITFNSTQKNLITDKIEEEIVNNVEFGKLYNKEINRTKNGEDKSIFIKNIENVQGDERDIIIFSIGYAPDKHSIMYNRFGTFNQEGGKNRLNVAITRARKQIYIVTSIFPHELKINNSENIAPILLQKYLQYCFAVSGTFGNPQHVLDSIYSASHNNKNIYLSTNLIKELNKKLNNSRFEVIENVGTSHSKIDIAIFDHEKQQYILGLDLSLTFNLKNDILEQYYYKPIFFQANGWNILRIWARDLWIDKDSVVNKILNIIHKEKLGG